ncbi:MAG: hypothetical protein KC776_15270 [Myxococcales bacterium]|nr:hypothetical protein [Myxococcales bacterium]MCB9581684.1 hypothetical protein [Polyangiaceae bacterium]
MRRLPSLIALMLSFAVPVLAAAQPVDPPAEGAAGQDNAGTLPDAPDAPPSEPAEAAPAPSAPAPAPTTDAPPPGYGQAPPPGYGEAPPPSDPYLPPLERSYPAPPPPQAPDKEGFSMPPWSARIDPFNWLLEGRLGLELEAGVLDFMTVELVPTFVVNDRPPTLNLSGAPDVLRQESNGLGPISGGALDVGLWLDGKAFRGYVIRVGVATYGYTYRTEDDAGDIDSVDSSETEGFAMFGSHARWGAFTIAGGIGLGVQLSKESRCFPDGATSVTQARSSGCDDELQISTKRDASEIVNLHSSIYPVDLFGRFSLGIVID